MQIVSRQLSGLGNQLFQYAAARYYSAKYAAVMRLGIDLPQNATSHGYPRPYLLSHFRIKAPALALTCADRLMISEKPSRRLLKQVYRRARGIQVFTEPVAQRYSFIPDLPIEPKVRTLYLIGYWQAYQFVNSVAEELRQEFQFRDPPTGKTLAVLNHIRQQQNPVSLHMRRGDFTLAVEGNIALPMDYYRRGIDYLRERLHHPLFFVFSDDIAFARANLPSGLPAIFVDHNDDSTAYDDLRLMSACHHHLIANSTFSWWGAWLNPRAEKIVYAPRYWQLRSGSYYPELFPPAWTLDSLAHG